MKSEVDRVGWDNASIYDVITTDENGRANTKYLPYGEYLVRETKTPKDYITAPDFTLSVTKDYSEYTDIDQIKIIDINNRPYTTQLKIVKKDLDSGKTVTLNSTTFKIIAREDIVSNGKIIYKAGETIKQKVSGKIYDSFTTNANNVIVPSNSFSISDGDEGSIILPLQLDAGKYYIEELNTPSGYLKLEKSVEFTIENIRDYDKDYDNEPILEVVVKNDKPVGTLHVVKTIKDNDVDKSFVDRSDLSKIKFRLTAKEDVLDMADGSIIYAKNDVIGDYNLSKDGKLTVNELPMGTYQLQEITTLDGLVLDGTKHEVKFIQTNLTTKVYTVTQNLVNKPTLVELSKIAITGLDELVGASMQLLDCNNNIIDEWVSEKVPHLLEGLKVGETYTLKEIKAPEGYKIAQPIEFVVENIGEVQRIEMIDELLPSQPETGDNMDISVIMETVLLSGISVMGLVFYIWKKKRESV